MVSALSSKVADNELVVLDELKFDSIKTKQMVAVLNALELNKTLVITAESDENVFKSARNIQGVCVMPVNNINVYDLLKYNKVVMTKDAVLKIEEVYA